MQAKIADLMHEEKLNAGDVLVQQGSESKKMSIISKGDFDVTISSRGGNDVKVDTLHPGDFSGMGALFTRSTHSASVIAKSDDSVAFSLKYEDFQNLMRDNFEIAQAMLAHMQEVARRDRSARTNRTRRGSTIETKATKLKIAMFDSKSYDMETFNEENKKYGFEITYFEARLKPETVDLAMGYDVVCVFVNDEVPEAVVKGLARLQVKMIALRCAGFNNVALEMAEAFNISVARVPAYSPYAVAEHAAALLLTLNRKTHKAYNRVRDGDFSIDGLVGFDLFGKTVGVIGTGKIGQCFIDIAIGFGCKIAAYDVYPNAAYAAKEQLTYMTLDEVLACADIISLHSPLLPSTKHMINRDTIGKMKKGVYLINTSRGALIETDALLENLKNGHIGGAGLDVYEFEAGYFFENLAGRVIQDDRLARLQAMPNCLITSHQAFLTIDALNAIARVTLGNVNEFAEGKRNEQLTNYVPAPK